MVYYIAIPMDYLEADAMKEQVLLTKQDIPQILRFLGYRGQEMDESARKQVMDGIRRMNEAAMPRSVSRILQTDSRFASGGEFPAACSFLTGEDIHRHLDGCTQIVLFAATLGSHVDTLIAKAKLRNVADQIILDACGSVLIEAYCDVCEAQLRAKLASDGRYLTTRFSPGYGDLPLDIQTVFLRTVNATKRIGLTVSPGGMLIPVKSVTAVLGIADHPMKDTRKRPDCTDCRARASCRFRLAGVRCG